MHYDARLFCRAPHGMSLAARSLSISKYCAAEAVKYGLYEVLG